MTAVRHRADPSAPVAELDAGPTEASDALDREPGIHRDPAAVDPLGTATFAQRLVHRVSGALSGRGTTRRSFLTKTAVIGSALAVNPFDFLLKPGTAYGYVCGTCSDGWTAFCCTINNGANSCPPGSFVAGWWKADNAAYCCGAARYIIDCNASCPTQCRCRCAGGACDGRRTCCNQFRYGQCHQEISCYGPVVCRVATCTPPWQYDPSCTTSSATDNRTRDHGAPCLSTDCAGGAIAAKYAALGGTAGFLGPVTVPEKASADGRGRYAKYTGGNIYWTARTGAHEVHGALLKEFERLGTPRIGYPTTDTLIPPGTATTGPSQNFEKGRIYDRGAKGVFAVLDPMLAKYRAFQGYLGLPTSAAAGTGVRGGTVQTFDFGRIFGVNGNVAEVHGAVNTHHQALGGVAGQLGYPLTDLNPIDDGRGKSQWFEGGLCWYTATTGAHSVWGKVFDRYVAIGHCKGPLGYPKSEPKPVGDGRGTYAEFERGRIYATEALGGHAVSGPVLSSWLTDFGGPGGRLGYPTGELGAPAPGGSRRQSFERGTLILLLNGNVTLAS
jgi:uncharacterized protein with LGFP repeats